MEHHESSSQEGIVPTNSGSLQEAPSSLLPEVLGRITQIEDTFAAQPSTRALLEAVVHPQWEIRAAAGQALGDLEPQATLEPLLNLLQDEHHLVRAAAVHALGDLARRLPGAPVPLECVLLALRDEAWEVREMAVLVLGKLNTYPSEPLLQAALRDSNGCVRDAAQYALNHREACSLQANDEAQRSVFPAFLIQAHTKQRLFHLWLVASRQFSLLNRTIWMMSALAMIIACVLTLVLGVNVGWSLTVAALSASVLGAAHIYGAESDAGLEIVLSTPTSIRIIVLTRLVTVVSYNVMLAALISTGTILIHGGGFWTLVHLWLGPVLFVSSFSFALSLLLGASLASLAMLLFEVSQVFQFERPFFIIHLADLTTCVWQLHPVLLSVMALCCLIFAILYAPRYPRLMKVE